jgi:NADH:ubiquinone oxidoreductase subunit 6 (subunit J)
VKKLSFYIFWTFFSSLFLKSGLEIILDKNIGYMGPILVNLFMQTAVIFPVVSIFTTEDKK